MPPSTQSTALGPSRAPAHRWSSVELTRRGYRHDAYCHRIADALDCIRIAFGAAAEASVPEEYR